MVAISWQNNTSSYYQMNDLKYFETDLIKGVHKIRVMYTAKVRTNVMDWVKEYSFRYSLTPAKFWKSFGSLTISVTQLGNPIAYTTNLANPTEGKIATHNNWTFQKLPDEYFDLTYVPKVSWLANVLIWISPFWLSAIFFVLATLLHIKTIKRYRAHHLENKYSTPVILGSLVLLLFVFIFYISTFEIIDSIIGEPAGRYHGYTVMVIILYPFTMPFYWIAMWLCDKTIKRKLLTPAQEVAGL